MALMKKRTTMQDIAEVMGVGGRDLFRYGLVSREGNTPSGLRIHRSKLRWDCSVPKSILLNGNIRVMSDEG